MRLSLERVAIARGGRTLLHDISADFRGAEMIAILGANGAGKTSLLQALSATIPPANGSIRIDGISLATFDARARARRIAFVDGTEPVLSALTVREAVASARFAHHRWWDWQPSADDENAVDTALDRVALTPFRERELGTLSAGERQRVWIAVALAQCADIILLDEPTSHLDLRYAVETLELMRDLAHNGALVIAVLHLLEEAAAFCDRVLVLGEGRVIADGPPLAALTTQTIERAFGITIDVEHHAETISFHRRPVKAPHR